MVAVIKAGSSIHRILNYNEQKVKEGLAECISAINYPIEVEKLTLKNKLNRLLNQAALNENVTRNSVHISLNFDPSEQLSKEQLNEIADTYMQKIGFGEQPYLVYQHADAGHPHIHIVTLKVRKNGSRIDIQNIGRNQSEKARKEIEQMYNLVKAEDSKQRQAYQLKPVNVQKVQYGRSETKGAITNVLDAVLNSYKYTSLPELNAVLQQYNIIADRGSEHSRIFHNNGLVYRIVDDKGNKVGVPIKASDFYSNPGLQFLKTKFQENELARQPHKIRVRNAIDLASIKNPHHSVQSLIKSLEKDAIYTVLRQNEEGLIYGITYVDHRTKCIFNGSDLGKQYTAKSILERCNELKETPGQKQKFAPQSSSKTSTQEEQMKAPSAFQNKDGIDLLETLLQHENTSGYVPNQLTGKGKKKRKKRISKRL